MKIPVSVIIVTKNEEKKIGKCLDALKAFSQIIIVDSQSQDKTAEIAARDNVELVSFIWNRQYPKKRQWCLDNLNLNHDWILFVDADEIMTEELVAELADLFSDVPEACGYFIKSRYMMNGKILQHGKKKKKLVLFD
ncbi:MAG: glycosyltransferase family 2 protein, partial [Micavibrio aeruginosavorus]